MLKLSSEGKDLFFRKVHIFVRAHTKYHASAFAFKGNATLKIAHIVI